MKRLISIFAAGALVLAVAPTVFAAQDVPCYSAANGIVGETTQVDTQCTTTVNFTVTQGTTLWVPETFTIGGDHNWPGQTVTSDSFQTVYWMSNEANNNLTAGIDAGLHNGNSPYDSAHLIDKEDLYLATSALDVPGTWQNLENHAVIHNLAADGAEYNDVTDARSSQDFMLKVYVPSVVSGNYTGTMNWYIEEGIN